MPEPLKNKLKINNGNLSEKINILLLDKIDLEIETNDTLSKTKDFFGRY